MRDPEQLQEIENLGEEEEEFFPKESRRKEGGSALPIFQAALCVLALIALLILKFTNAETYNKVTNWYQSEAAREIELPEWGEKREELNSPSSAKSVSSSLPTDLANGSLQKL